MPQGQRKSGPDLTLSGTSKRKHHFLGFQDTSYPDTVEIENYDSI